MPLLDDFYDFLVKKCIFFYFFNHIFTLQNLGNFQVTRNYMGLNLNLLHIIAAWTCPDKNNYGPLRVNILKNPCKAPIFYDFLVKKWVFFIIFSPSEISRNFLITLLLPGLVLTQITKAH